MRTLLYLSLVSPLLAGMANAQLSVSPEEFGATPNYPSDDAWAIQKAIDKAVEWTNNSGGDAIVDLSPGTYYCETRNGGAALNGGCINGAGVASEVMFWVGGVPQGSSLTIRGTQTTLLCEDNAARMFFVRCNKGKVVFENFAIDYARLPYLIGEVQGPASGGSVTILPLELDGFGTTDIQDLPAPTPSNKHWGRLIDPAHPGRPVIGSSNVYRRGDNDIWTTLSQPGGPGTDVTISLAPTQGALDKIQYPYLFSYHPRANNVFWMGDSVDVQLLDITAYASGQFFCLGTNLDAFRADGCQIVVKGRRWRSTNGDGIHIVDSENVVIENSVFEGLSDDCIALGNCDGFTVKDNTFRNCNRNAIVLDGISDLANPSIIDVSRNGSIQDNDAVGMGSSPLYAMGGSYETVVESGNSASGNHLTTATNVMRHVRFRSLNDGSLVLNAVEAGRSWSSFDPLSVALPSGADSPTWDLIRMNLGTGGAVSHLLLSRGARTEQSWLYATANRSNPAGTLRLYGPEEHANQGLILRNAVDQAWDVEDIGGGAVVLHHVATGKVLTALPSGTTLASGDSVALRHRFTAASALPMDLQEWSLELVDD